MPTDDAVKLAMDVVLREAQTAGRRPTIAAVERRLDVTHATFYRNHTDLITWFKQQANEGRGIPAGSVVTAAEQSTEQALASLRQENTQLRRTVTIYAEAIRQLTLDYEELRGTAQAQTGVANLDSWRRGRG